jgi:hypothetical protein
LRDRASELAGRFPGAAFKVGPSWDAIAFIEFCEGAAGKPDSQEYNLAVAIQEMEWLLLMQWCARRFE